MSDLPWVPSATAALPFQAPTVADLEAEGDIRKKVQVQLKHWHLDVFNMLNKEDIAKYEKLRMKLYILQQQKRGAIARDAVQVLQKTDGQHLYQIVEWVEFDFRIFDETAAEEIGMPTRRRRKSAASQAIEEKAHEEDAEVSP